MSQDKSPYQATIKYLLDDMLETKDIIRRNLEIIKPALGSSLELPEIKAAWNRLNEIASDEGK